MELRARKPDWSIKNGRQCESQQIETAWIQLRTPAGNRDDMAVAFARSTGSSHHLHRVRDLGAGNMEQARSTRSGYFCSRRPSGKVESGRFLKI